MGSPTALALRFGRGRLPPSAAKQEDIFKSFPLFYILTALQPAAPPSDRAGLPAVGLWLPPAQNFMTWKMVHSGKPSQAAVTTGTLKSSVGSP